MGERFRKGMLLTVYSMGCGLMLSLFPFIKSGVNLIFSLLALVIGFYFFKNFSSLRSRILFFVIALLFFVVFTIVITMIMYAISHPQGAA